MQAVSFFCRFWWLIRDTSAEAPHAQHGNTTFSASKHYVLSQQTLCSPPANTMFPASKPTDTGPGVTQACLSMADWNLLHACNAQLAACNSLTCMKRRIQIPGTTKNGCAQNEETHPELRKYTEMLRTVAGSKVGSWLGLSAFNQQAAKDKAIADAEGVCPRHKAVLTPCLKIWLADAECVPWTRLIPYSKTRHAAAECVPWTRLRPYPKTRHAAAECVPWTMLTPCLKIWLAAAECVPWPRLTPYSKTRHAAAECVPWTMLTPCLKIWLADAAQCILDALLPCVACTQSLQHGVSCCNVATACADLLTLVLQ